MSTMQVKNRRSKISPGGVITLPVSARKTLGMERGGGSSVTVAVADQGVVLQPAGADGGFRVSAKGQLELRGDARKLLESGAARHFYLELDDDKHTVLLRPYE
jgi:bifunctional DNA-binding transcriptional regulator/antitoxin component of YhaV-PrlF toxin-antitoxin module